ncbi:MAG: hypothetical protein H6623_07090 [Bdellovibrionaceae bacterium]|nr:hypothetical protein [Pseudobdellovibrionaceae bacterium]
MIFQKHSPQSKMRFNKIDVKFVILFLFIFATTVSRAQSLSQEEKGLIKDYTAGGYFISNATKELLDYGVANLKAPLLPLYDEETAYHELHYIYKLNKALDKLPSYGTSGKTVVYRGIYHTSEESIESRYPIGKVWIERRYSSSTVSLDVATQFAMGLYKNEGCGGCDQHVKNADPKKAVIVSIVSRSGKDISNLAAQADEKEILFKSGVIFKVIKAERDKKHRFLVDLVELDANNLSKADKLALDKFEKERADRIIADRYSKNVNGKKIINSEALNTAVEEANSMWEKWRSSGDLDKPVELSEDGEG